MAKLRVLLQLRQVLQMLHHPTTSTHFTTGQLANKEFCHSRSSFSYSFSFILTPVRPAIELLMSLFRRRRVDKKKDSSPNDVPVRPLRWGIAPVTLIADDFATALTVLPKEHHAVTACTSAYESVAEAFAKKHNCPNIYHSCLDMARSKDVDVVYISSLNPFHLDVSRMMLDHGKHVLCEKPLCLNEDQTLQLIGHAHSRSRFLLEGIWSRFLPIHQFIRREIKDGALGEIHTLKCKFGLPMQSVNRVMRRKLGGGVTLELGVYAIQLAMLVYGRPPNKVLARGAINDSGVDEEANITLDYGYGSKAEIVLSALKRFENNAIIKGGKGTMTLQNFWCPQHILYSNGRYISFPMPESKFKTYFPNRLALCFEAEEVRQCVMAGNYQSEALNHNDSLTISRIADEVRRQIGVVFKEDKSEPNEPL